MNGKYDLKVTGSRTRYIAGRSRVRFSQGARKCFLLQNVQADSAAHSASYFQWLRRSVRKANHSPLSGTEIENKWHLKTPVFPVCLQAVQKDYFTHK